MTNFRFISGLPRAGSTLLSAILRQNPVFHAGHSSPVFFLCEQISSYFTRSEFSTSINEEIRKNLYRSIFNGYYQNVILNEEVHTVFDTCRYWSSKMEFLSSLFGDIKIICCVRPAAEIVQSIENIISSSPNSPTTLFDSKASLNVYTRADHLLSPVGMVGSAASCLKGGFFGEYSKNLLIVRYESLSKNPEHTMGQIYEFIGEDPFNHNFDDVEYRATTYDLAIGVPDLHTVRSKVEYRQAPIFLPPDLTARLELVDFWKRSPEGSNAKIV